MFDQNMYNAVRTCYKNQCVLVVSKGNDGNNNSHYPSEYGNNEWVLSVGASGTDGAWKTTINGDNWWTSNYGNGVDVIAPGTTQLIRSTIYTATGLPCSVLPGDYQCFNGTSAAAPHVAGVAALMLSEHNVNNGVPNDLAPEDVENIIERTAFDEGVAGYDQFNGHGRVNAGNAVVQVSYPTYHVFHSGAPITSQQAFASQLIYIGNGVFGNLGAGYYQADRVLVTHNYLDVFAPGVQVLDAWSRNSSVIGTGANNPPDNAPWQAISYVVNQNAASVVAQTNCWYVTLSASGSTINQWFPAPPSQLKTAYSLHLYDPSAVGVDEVNIAEASLTIYPSPANDFLNVQWIIGSHEKGRVEVHDMTGRLVKVVSFSAGLNAKLQISVAELSQGTYSVRLVAGEAQSIGRFLKE